MLCEIFSKLSVCLVKPSRSAESRRHSQNITSPLALVRSPSKSWSFIFIMMEIAEVKSQDAVYVLAYSIILLNTDQHNPQIRVSVHMRLSQCTLPHIGTESNEDRGLYAQSSGSQRWRRLFYRVFGACASSITMKYADIPPQARHL